MKAIVPMILVVVGLLVTTSGAYAQNKKPAAAGGNVLQLKEIEIVGRVQKPVASVDVGRKTMSLTLAELRQPFLDRIEEAISHAPF